jgi:hypothetical protein
MSKFLNTLLLAFVAFIIIAGASLYVFRYSLLETLFSEQLRQQGFPLQSIVIEDISLNTLRLHNLVAGTDDELQIDKIWITWNLGDLFAGKPILIEISGLKVAINLNKEYPFFNARQSMTSTAAKPINLPWLPIFSLHESALHLHSTTGDLTVAFSGNIAPPDPSGIQTINLSAIISGSFGRANGMLTGTFDTKDRLQGKVIVSEGGMNLPAATISGFTGEAVFAFAALQLQHIQTKFVVSDMHVSGAELVKVIPEQAENLAAFKLDSLAVDQIAFNGEVYGSPWRGEFDLNVGGGRLIAESLNIRQMSVSLPLQVNSDQKTLHVNLRNPAQIMLGPMDFRSDLNLRSPMSVAISQADFEWRENVLKHNIALTFGKFSLLAQQEEAPPIEARIHPGKITFNGQFDLNKKYQGQIAVNDAAMLIPSVVQLKAVSANLRMGATEPTEFADFTIGQVQHMAAEPFFKTLSISGNVKNQGIDGKPMAYLLEAESSVAGLRYLKLTGKHIPVSGDGALEIQLMPLRFSPEGLQPAALSPLLDKLDDVSGTLHANAHVQWSKRGVDNSRGKVELKNISFVNESVKVNGLNALLNLNNLLSPSSGPKQTITIQSIDPGIPLEDLLVSYQIKSMDSSQIVLEKAQFSIMDGTVSLQPTIIDSDAVRSDMLINIDNINLADFFDLIQVEGFAATGHLGGNIPITLENGQIAIKNGHLAAKSPGVLRLNSEKAAKALAGTGEEMKLLLQALQDFHYTELSLKLDKSFSHDLIAKLSVLGNNPKVKNGRAFRLNIKLETDINKILDTINQGYNLSHEILRSSIKLR